MSSSARQAATFSLVAPLASFGIGIFLQPQVRGNRIAVIVLSLTSMFLIIAGLVLGIAALVATKRHGRAGIFGKALAGTCINALLVLAMLISIPVWMKAIHKSTLLRPAVHAPAATRIQDDRAGFSFDLPDGYQPFAPAAKPQGYSHAFLRQVANEPIRVLLVKPLGGRLAPQRIRPGELPPGPATLTSFDWRGLQVDGIRVPEKLGGADYLTLNIQIPLRSQGIQLGFGGPAAAELQPRVLAEQVLSTFDGETNW